MNDLMTPLERKQALMVGKPVDRLPITFSHESYSAKLIGLNYRQGFNSPENVAHKEINLYKQYGIDGISVAYTSVNFAMRYQSQVRSPKDSPASVIKHRFADLVQVHELDLQPIEFQQDISQQVNYQALEIIYDQIGREIHPTYSISAPLTLASGLVPADQILRAMRKDPSKVHQLLRFTTEAMKQILKPTRDFPGLSYFIYDPVSSGSLLSPKQYAEFCLPYTKEIVEYLKHVQPNTWVGLHICGDTTRSLETIASTGIDGLSIDQLVDLSEAKSIIGNQVTLLGNVDPIGEFLYGSPESMDNAVKLCFDQAKDTDKGFIIRSGCAVPYETDPKNVDAYIKSAKKYASQNHSLSGVE